jgi:hypothetical protein
MGTRAQIDIHQGGKVVRVYSEFDGSPRNILLTLRAAASAGRSNPFRIARTVVREFGGDTIYITDEDQSKWVSYHYVVDASSSPWHVRYTKMPTVDLPIKSDGSLDCSTEALNSSRLLPAVTRSVRIGQ